MTLLRSRMFAIACLTAAAVTLVDQVFKAAALTWLSETERIPILGDLLGLQLAFNPGAILSLGADATWVITLISVIAVGVLGVAASRARTPGWAVGIGLILGGAIGNLIDRLFAPPGFARGHVTDFLAYGELFIGNLADVALGIGVAVLGVSMWRRHRQSPSPSAAVPHGAGPATGDGAP